MIKSFEAKLGSKAECFADIKNKRYYSAESYRSAWFKGLLDQNPNNELRMMLKNNILREYAILFLERSFVKNPNQFMKRKIENNEREIYLGSNEKVFGIFIAPEYSEDKGWCSYKLKGLKVPYTYLSKGQIVKEGVLKGKITEDGIFRAKRIEINTLGDVCNFYEEFKHSRSAFEPIFIDEYLKYIEKQENWKNVPLLLPEVRWNKKAVCHVYRVDYLVINYVTGRRLALELSPISTHMNRENFETQWVKENDKRNKYLFDYHVPTVVYTDAYLKSIDKCFEEIKKVFDIEYKSEMLFEELIKKL